MIYENLKQFFNLILWIIVKFYLKLNKKSNYNISIDNRMNKFIDKIIYKSDDKIFCLFINKKKFYNDTKSLKNNFYTRFEIEIYK